MWRKRQIKPPESVKVQEKDFPKSADQSICAPPRFLEWGKALSRISEMFQTCAGPHASTSSASVESMKRHVKSRYRTSSRTFWGMSPASPPHCQAGEKKKLMWFSIILIMPFMETRKGDEILMAPGIAPQSRTKPDASIIDFTNFF